MRCAWRRGRVLHPELPWSKYAGCAAGAEPRTCPLEARLTGVTHTHPIRVYYEDTDLAGIVYYANYLKFIERGRSEWIRSLGVDQGRLKAEQGIVFAVRRIEADYLRPARFDDELTVVTRLSSAGGARIHLVQDVLRGAERLFVAHVTLVCLTETGQPARLPAEIRRRLAPALH